MQQQVPAWVASTGERRRTLSMARRREALAGRSSSANSVATGSQAAIAARCTLGCVLQGAMGAGGAGWGVCALRQARHQRALPAFSSRRDGMADWHAAQQLPCHTHLR